MYDKLLELEQENRLRDLVKCGIISVTLLNHFYTYKKYLNYLKTNTSIMQCVTNTSIDVKYSERHINTIISKMKS